MTTNVRSKLLANRGIGKKYHTMSLTNYENKAAQDFLDWLEKDGQAHLGAGRGISFFSDKQDGYDIAMLATRALILSGGMDKLRCVNFLDAVEDNVISMIYDQHPPLMILNFFPDTTKVRPDHYGRLENCLNYYLDNGIPVLLHFPVNGEEHPSYFGNLISPVFLDRIDKSNKKFVVK